MDEDTKKLFEAVVKLNKRLSELDQRSMEIESILAATNQFEKKQEDNIIIDQESTIMDPYNVSGHKSLSLPNGGVVRMKSKSLCVNGHHIINNNDEILFCSKCNSILCNNHSYNLAEPICINCLKDEVKDFDNISLYLLFALKNGIPLRKLKLRLNVKKEEINAAINKLESLNCITQDLFFRYKINIHGENVLNTAQLLYDLSSLLEQKKE